MTMTTTTAHRYQDLVDAIDLARGSRRAQIHLMLAIAEEASDAIQSCPSQIGVQELLDRSHNFGARALAMMTPAERAQYRAQF